MSFELFKILLGLVAVHEALLLVDATNQHRAGVPVTVTRARMVVAGLVMLFVFGVAYYVAVRTVR